MTVEVSGLKNYAEVTSSSKSEEAWNFVGSIPLSANAPNQPSHVTVRSAPARFPDYLMPDQQISMNKGMFQSVWLTISVPGNAGSGGFYGNVTVKSNEGELFLPVYLKVYPFSMPSERHLKVTEWYITQNFEKLHGVECTYSEAWFNVLRSYAENMAAHRQNVFQVSMNSIDIEIAVPKLGYLDVWHATYRKAARSGTELWYYTVGIYQANSYPNKTIDMPVMDNRILHWLNYRS